MRVAARRRLRQSAPRSRTGCAPKFSSGRTPHRAYLVLGVVDHEIGAGHEFGVAAVSVVEDGLDAAAFGTGPPELVGVRLVIHQVHSPPKPPVGFDR